MLVGLDGFITYLSAPALQGASTLRLVNGTALCAATVGTNFTYIKLSDGTLERIIKVTGCTGSVVDLAAPLDVSFPTGSCARYVLTTQIVCELMAQGSCSAATTSAACSPVVLVAGRLIPDIVVGELFEHVIAWTGTPSFTVSPLVLPSWMSVSPIGVTSNTAIRLSGTPVDDTAKNFQITITGCGGSRVEMTNQLCYCQAAGV